MQQNGKQTISSITNDKGFALFDNELIKDSNTLLIIKKEGYSTLVVKCPCEGLTYALSPVMQNLDGIRIVLSWGQTPVDLDAHLWYGDKHIYW